MAGSVGGALRRGSSSLWLAALLLAAPAAARTPARGPSPAASPPVEMRLPADIVFDHNLPADSVVTFRHTTHVAFAANTCTGCHPRPFHLLKPTHRTTHAVMNSGGSCGVCHDGKQAFGVREPGSCGTCHAGRSTRALAVQGTDSSSAPAARKLPRPHRYPAGEFSPGRVTFRHETHVKHGESCVSCHPRPFAMRSAAPLPGGAMHERTACGACHDGTRAFGAEDPARCSRCHVETAGTP